MRHLAKQPIKRLGGGLYGYRCDMGTVGKLATGVLTVHISRSFGFQTIVSRKLCLRLKLPVVSIFLEASRQDEGMCHLRRGPSKLEA